MSFADWLVPWQWEGSRWIVLTAMGVGLACALPGVWLVLRRMSLTGDAISHSVLPGLVLGFLWGGQVSSPWLFFGAAVSGFLCVMLIEVVRKRLGVREDAAIGLVFSAFFAMGVLGLRKYASRVDLDPDCVLFGALETSIHGARWLGVPVVFWQMWAAVGVGMVMTWLGRRSWFLLAFDPAHARSLGVREGWMQKCLLGWTALVVTTAFQAVGAVLAIGLLILPGACGWLWARTVRGVLAVAVGHAVVSAVAGFYLAWWLGVQAASAMVVAGAVPIALGVIYRVARGGVR